MLSGGGNCGWQGSGVLAEDICRAIRRQFHEAPPNGWLLGWDEARCFAEIAAAAAPHNTTNHTSFDYGFCNWFEVHVDNRDRCWTLTVKLSFVIPAYCFHWTEYESHTHGAVISAAPDSYQGVENKVRAAIEGAGFFLLPDEWGEHKVHGVELELSGTENVTVSKCLFSDFED